MDIDKFYELGLFAIKCIILAASVYLIMSLWQYLDKKFLETIPKLPKFILYTLIVFFAIIWVLAKLLGFGIIDA